MNAADRHLTVPGARLRYRDEGAGHALVLLHGWTLDLEMWEPQAALAAEFRVLRYDRRGFGLSSGRPSPAEDVTDLRALLAALGVVSPVLVGMSQGARVVLEFAARYPGAAAGLVLDGPPPIAAVGVPEAPAGDVPMDELRATAARAGLAAFRKSWSAHPLTQLVTEDAAAHALLARMLARYPGQDLAAPSSPRECLEPGALAGIRVPTLIVNGARDIDSRRHAARLLRDKLLAAELESIDNAGHLPNLDAPHEYNRLVSEFARERFTSQQCA